MTFVKIRKVKVIKVRFWSTRESWTKSGLPTLEILAIHSNLVIRKVDLWYKVRYGWLMLENWEDSKQVAAQLLRSSFDIERSCLHGSQGQKEHKESHGIGIIWSLFLLFQKHENVAFVKHDLHWGKYQKEWAPILVIHSKSALWKKKKKRVF